VVVIGEDGFCLLKDLLAFGVFGFVELEFADLIFESDDLGEVLLFVVVGVDVDGLLEVLLTAFVGIFVFSLVVGDGFHAFR
jgi:hypothetical protein